MQLQSAPYPTRPHSLLIVAGEASGDDCGGALVQALCAYDPHLQTYGLGGAQMRSAGMETLFDIEALSAVGAIEVCKKLPQGWRMMRRLRREALRRNTRVAVLIDAPVFNLPFARQLKKAGLRVVYYVSPQIWAWRQGRVKKIARRVDKMLTLFPFEVPFYTAAGVDAEYVGHPLIDRLHQLPSPLQAAEALDLDRDRVVKHLDRYGNTSAGSIPIALDETFRAGKINRGHHLLMSGFGAGLTWGTTVFRW